MLRLRAKMEPLLGPLARAATGRRRGRRYAGVELDPKLPVAMGASRRLLAALEGEEERGGTLAAGGDELQLITPRGTSWICKIKVRAIGRLRDVRTG